MNALHTVTRFAFALFLACTAACASGPCPAGTTPAGDGCVAARDAAPRDDAGASPRSDAPDDDAATDAPATPRADGCTADDPLDPAGHDDNCDGAEGVLARTVYVAPAPRGTDTNRGTPDSPVASLAGAWALISGDPSRRVVLLADGANYAPRRLAELLALGVTVSGGHDPARGWSRAEPARAAERTVVRSTAGAIVVDSATRATLAYLTIASEHGTDAPAGAVDVTGLRLVRPRGVVLDHVVVRASDGADGAPGRDGASSGEPHAASGDGGPLYDGRGGVAHVVAACGAPGGRPLGGVGGSGNLGADNRGRAGEGGAPGGRGSEGGAAAQPGGNGDPGRDGAPGRGANGVLAFASDGSFVATSGSAGAPGTMGDGGGGGGAGGPSALCGFSIVRPGGGAGGAGGCGGAGGGPGGNGGHSVALVVVGGELPRFDAVTLVAGSGGAGGTGGNGAAGGRGGAGGAGGAGGLSGACEFLAGGAGGAGGTGGSGGGGGGGAGGWSLGLALVGLASPSTAMPEGVAVRQGSAGRAGTGGGPNGADGVAGQLRPIVAQP